MKLLVNGRFLTRPAKGVDRSASEIVRALVRLAQADEFAQPLQIAIAVPRGAPPNEEIRKRLGLGSSIAIRRSRFSGYLWEQSILARVDPEAILLSLCNIGPIVRRRQFVLIHDTQIRDMPESYSLPFRLAYRLLQPALARRAGLIGTVSEHSRQRMQAHGLAAGRTIHVLPNGIDHIRTVPADTGILERLGLGRGQYILALNHPARHKNIPMLMRACAARSDRPLPLVLAGGAEAAVFQKQVPGGDDTVMKIGAVSDGELRALYENARLFLFPSLTEGFGFPALEAMTCGCPVIASTGGAIPEICGDAAVLCEPDSERAWTDAIEALQDDPERLRDLAERGSACAAPFTWERAARQLLGALPQAMAGAASVPASRKPLAGSLSGA